MSYKQWFENHALKHKKIVDKLIKRGFSKEEIVDYFSYENLKEKERDFCPLFAKNKKCHDIEDLNCYFCGCPYFRFDDNAPKIKSTCFIKSKFGRKIESKNVIHQDCSLCLLPHKKSFILKHFDLDWKRVMKRCDESE